jgi:hypothetical protein
VFFAVFKRTSVVLPIAETTTAILVPFAASFATEATAFDNRSWSARLEPPNLTTIFLPDFSLFINQTPIHAQTLNQKVLLRLCLVKIIEVIVEAKELRSTASFF